MSIDWFRWYHGSISDPKFTVIARKSGQPRALVLSVWAGLLECASQAEDRGSLAEVELDTLAACLDVDDEAVEVIFQAMIGKGLIVDGRIAAWDRRQVYREDDSRDRVRKFREKQKSSNDGNDEKRDVTLGNAPVTPQSREEEEEEQNREEQNRPEGEQRREEEDARTRKRPPAPISPDWQPSQAALAILSQQGIDEPFAQACLPEFRLYWTERGEKRPGWDASFVNSVKRSWEKRPLPRASPKSKADQLHEHNQRAIAEWLAQDRPVIEGEVFHGTH